MFGSLPLSTILLWFVALLFVVSAERMGQAACAHWLGDDTAAEEGRLTLNPFVHADVLGTYVLPVIFLLMGGLSIAWARPIPINGARFSRRIRLKTGFALVAAAGPLSSLLVAFFFTAVLALGLRFSTLDPYHRVLAAQAAFRGYDMVAALDFPTGQAMLMALCGSLVHVGVLLSAFNLIPLGSLDGAMALRGLIPDRHLRAYDRFQSHPYVWMAFLLLALSGLLGLILNPLQNLIYTALDPFLRLLLGA